MSNSVVFLFQSLESTRRMLALAEEVSYIVSLDAYYIDLSDYKMMLSSIPID